MQEHGAWRRTASVSAGGMATAVDGPATARSGPRSLGARATVLAGVVAGLLAAMAMAGWLMFCSEVAAEPTAVPGVRSSTWTPVTAVTALVIDRDAFSGDWATLPILGGLGLLALYGALAGITGAAVVTYTLGGHPGPLVALIAGVAYGVALQVLVVNLLVNAIQPDGLLYESLPRWGWWVGHAAYGAALGALVSRRLRRGPP